MTTYKIMSFNLKNNGIPASFHKRAFAVEKIIWKYRPDIVALQEFGNFMYEDLRNLNDEYQWILYGRGPVHKKAEECGFLIKKGRFDHVETRVFWLSDTPGIPGSKYKKSIYPRIVVVASLQSADHTFYLANTHLDHLLESVRLSQSVVLANLLKENYPLDFMILTGDFNAVRSASCIKALQDMTGLKEMIADTDGPSVRELLKRSMRKQPIDHFFGGRGIDSIDNRILSDKIDGMYPSDHNLLLCEIRIKNYEDKNKEESQMGKNQETAAVLD